MVTVATDTTNGVATDCTNQSLSGATLDASCSLRDALAAAKSASGGNITFASAAGQTFASAQTITLNSANGTLNISANMNIIGPGANLLSIDGGSAIEIFKIARSSTVSISGVTITNGSFYAGAGIENNGTLTVVNSAFSNDIAIYHGGAIANRGTLAVANSTFSGNSSTYSGGAIYSDHRTTLTVANSTFSANTTTYSGGGIYGDHGSVVTAVNSTFSGNTANNGGGMYGEGTMVTANVLSPDAIAGSGYTDNGGSIIAGVNGVTSGNINLAPLGYYFGTTQTMPSLPGSAAICAGLATGLGNDASNNPITLATTDQRGNLRSTTVYSDGSTACVDAGAVQTAYSLAFTTSPSNPQETNVALTPTPVVQLSDLNPATGQPAPIALAGAPITVALGTGSFTSGATTQVSTDATGAATFSGLAAFTAESSDYLIASASAGTYTITANSGSFNINALTLSPGTLPAAQVAASYSKQIAASNGAAPYTYAITGGSLPAGLSLTASGTNAGLLSGTPTAGGTFNFTITATDSLGSTGSQSYTLAVSAPTIVFSPSNATLTAGTYGTAGYSAAITASGGTGSYTYALAGGSLPAGLSLNTASGAITGTPTAAGAYTFTISAKDSSTGAGPYTCTSQTYSLTINRAVLTVTVNPGSITYGQALPAYSASYSGFVNGDSTTVPGAAVSGAPSFTTTATANSTVGSYTINAAVGSLSAANYSFAYASGTLAIKQAAPAVTVALTSGTNPAFVQNPITFTAAVGFATVPSSSTLPGPTSAVTFFDGATPITACSGVTLSAYSSATGTATAACAVSTLAAGSHSITATYSGDTNFTAGTSNASSETVADFTVNAQDATLTVKPGASGQYTFTLSPQSPATTFPTAINLTVNGLPPGATYTFSPSATIAAGAGSTTVTLTIQMAQKTAQNAPGTGAGGFLASRLAGISLALLLLPFAGKLRKTGRLFSRMLPILLLLIAGMAAAAGLSGCGGSSSKPQSYNVTVTATSGTLSHTSNVTLTVE